MTKAIELSQIGNVLTVVEADGEVSVETNSFEISDSTTPALRLYTGATRRADFIATSAITTIRSFSNSPLAVNIGGSGETEAFRIAGDGNITVGDITSSNFGSSLGQLRIINDASSAPASLALFGHHNTSTGTVFAKIDFASQETGFAGQVTANIEAQAQGTSERAADLVFKTRPDTSGSSAEERLRITSDGYVGINCTPSANDLVSGSSFGIPKLHIKDDPQSGKYELIARFESGTDADDSGATIVVNHANDRGLALQGGRGTLNKSFGAIKSIDNQGRLSNVMAFSGESGQGVDYIAFYTGASTSTTSRLHIDSDGKISIGGNHSALNQLHILDDTTSSWDGSLNKSRAVLRLETHYDALGIRAVDDYGSGIVFNHLGGHSGQHNDDSHAFIGIRVNDTSGHERSKLIFATNNETTTAAHDSGLKEAMHIKPNGSVHMAIEKNDIGALPSNVVNQKLTIMPSSSGYPGSHVLFAGQFNGNWLDGTTGIDSCYGLGWVYQSASGGSQALRAGIAYDHRSSEELKYWSSYGAHTWYVDSATSGNETADTCDTKAMQINKLGSVINRAKPDYGIYTESGVQTINGGSKNVQYLEDCYGQWIVVAKIQQIDHIKSAMASVAQIDTSLTQATGTEWSSSFGDSYPIAVRYVSSSKWSEWRDYRGVDFIHGVPHGRKWKNFFTNGASSGMTTATGGVGATKYGWTCDGAWDGKGRWHNPTFNWFRMSDPSGYQSQYVSESFFTTPTASTGNTALFLNYASDAKFGVHHFSNTGGQDTAVTSVYGYDDNLLGHEDNFPNAPANHGGTDITAMPLWICINVGSIGQFN